MERGCILLALSMCAFLVNAHEAGEGLSLSKSIQNLTRDLYLEEVKISKRRNVIISPLSIHLAMSILYHGAEGNSRKQLGNALGLNDASDEVNLEEVKVILEKYREPSDENITLIVANALYVADGLKVNQEFTDLAENHFDTKIDELDFVDTKHAVELINSWAANKTNNLINKVVTEEGLDPDARMVLMNAVYFKAKWLKPFDGKHTRTGNFSTPTKGQVETEFMFTRTSLESAYIEELNATLVALPYADEDYKMLIFLPEESSNVEDLEMALFNTSPCPMRDHLMLLKQKETDFLFPKFEAGSDISFVRHFQQLGVTDIFGDGADFTGISDANDVEVGDIVHKTKIKVSEEGSEAAAVTAVFHTKIFIQNPKISVNRPFIFSIFDTKHNIPIFMGKIVDPLDGETDVDFSQVEEKDNVSIEDGKARLGEEVKDVTIEATRSQETVINEDEKATSGEDVKYVVNNGDVNSTINEEETVKLTKENVKVGEEVAKNGRI
eukprot:GFUD01129535.1.p1 GENE.GFUD01129535.1~~GFUD01129535.1.p1  ORF type:complete len:526 (+),score=108.59 GFUD01129535.1:90-1580(+)